MQTNDSPEYDESQLKDDSRQATLVEVHANHIVIQQLEQEIEQYKESEGGQECIRAFS